MPQLGLEPTTPVLGRAKTFHALELTATVIGLDLVYITAAACVVVKARIYAPKLGFNKQCW
jgi:hypothetical protein